MAGLADLLLGKDNPLAEFVSDNRNKIRGAFAGLGSAPTFGEGLANASQYALQGATLDDRVMEKRQEIEQQKAAINKTAAYLRSQPGGAQFADAIENGMIDGSTAFKSWMDLSKGQAPQNPYMSAGDGNFFNWQTGEYVTNPNAQPDMTKVPTGYRQSTDGNLEFIPGGPADPSTQAKTTEAQRRNQQLASVIAPEVATVEQNWEALTKIGDQATGGVFSPAYQTARNSLGVIAQSYLYSVSGAAATDAEVTKIVDSVTPRPFDSPQATADKLRRVKQMAQAVIDAGGGVDPAAPAAGGVDDLLKKYGQ